MKALVLYSAFGLHSVGAPDIMDGLNELHNGFKKVKPEITESPIDQLSSQVSSASSSSARDDSSAIRIEIPRTCGRQPTAPKQQGPKKRKPSNCKVCGLQFDLMSSGFPYCYPHKKDQAGLHAQLKTEVVRTRGHDEDNKIAKEMLDAAEKARSEAKNHQILRLHRICPWPMI